MNNYYTEGNAIHALNAQIGLTRKEKKQMRDRIFEIDTTDKEYFEITSDNISPLREDEPEESLDRELALSNTKHREYGYFKIGKVVD